MSEEEAEVLRYKLHQSHERIWNYKLHLIKAYVQNWKFDIVHNAKDDSQATATQGKNELAIKTILGHHVALINRVDLQGGNQILHFWDLY